MVLDSDVLQPVAQGQGSGAAGRMITEAVAVVLDVQHLQHSPTDR